MSRTKVIFSGIAWTIIQNIVNILYGLVSVPYLLRYFGKEEYGLIGLALSVNVYVQLLDMGMTNSNVRFFSEFIAKDEQEKVQRLFRLSNLFYLILGLINSIVLFGLSFCVETFFNITSEQGITLRHLLWIIALNATFSWISVCYDQFLRANELIDWIKRRGTFLKLMQFVVLGLTILLHFNIETYFTFYIFVATIILPLTILKTKKLMPSLHIGYAYDRDMFHLVFPYAFSLFSFTISHFMAFNFRPLILGAISGPAAVAEFNIMNAIAMVVTIIAGSFMQVLLPIVTKMTVTSDDKGIHTIMNQGTKYVNILLSATIFLIILPVDEILTIYVGSQYQFLSPWIVVWLITLLLSHRNVMTSLVFTEKRLRSVAFMGFVAMILALICYFVFTPKYGVGGVVIGFVVHEVVHTLFYYVYFLPKRFHVNTLHIFLKSVLPVWIAFGGVTIGVYFLVRHCAFSTIMSITIKDVILGVSFLCVTWFVLLDRKDKTFLFSFINKNR